MIVLAYDNRIVFIACPMREARCSLKVYGTTNV